MKFWRRKSEPVPDVISEEPEDMSTSIEISPENKIKERAMAIKSKLKEDLRHKPKLGQHFSYEKLFRPISQVLMDQSVGEGDEGMTMACSRQNMNVSLTTKYALKTWQTSAWDLTLQAHGFSDFLSATYSTLNRYQLMYQRIFKTGAMGIAQWVVQPGPMVPGPVPPGNFFTLFECPWRRHGCSAFTYLKGQHVSLSHTERLLRGLFAGSMLTYDLTTHNTAMSYGIQRSSTDRKTLFVAEYKNEGDMRISLLRKDWLTDTEVVLDVDYVERKNGVRSSGFNAGIRRNLLGGGALNIILNNFSKIRGILDLPYGLDLPGANQVRLSYAINYDIPTSTLKHGMSLQI